MGEGLGGYESAFWRLYIFVHGRNPTSKHPSALLPADQIDSHQLSILRTLIMWSLASSDVIKGIITASYKQGRRDDDINQPLSVQPWGSDGDRRRYFLIEGQDDTHFRVYRESNYTGLKRTWWSVAGTIEELKALARKLEKDDGGHKAKTLSGKMLAALPRFEATEEVCALLSRLASPRTNLLMCCRNERKESIAQLGSRPSRDQPNPHTCTKAGLVVSAKDTPIPMKKTRASLMPLVPLQDARLAIRELIRQSKSVLLTLRVVDRSSHATQVVMVRAS